jgi:hypothetical protein
MPMQAHRGERGRLRTIHNLARLNTTHCTVHCVGFGASLGSIEKSHHPWDSISRPSSLWQVAILTTLLWPLQYNSINGTSTEESVEHNSNIILTHCGPVTQICVLCVFALRLWKTDDAKLPFNTHLVFTHLITQYVECKKIGPPGRIYKKNVTLLWINDLW